MMTAPMRFSTLRALALTGLLATTMAFGCASAPRPGVNVLGVSRAQMAADGPDETMLVEVTNPTGHTLTLAGFIYRFMLRDAEVGRGEVPLQRGIPAGQTAVIALPMPSGVSAAEVPALVIEGRLMTSEGYAQGGWNVRTGGLR